jgi:hypothetical protein
MLVPHQSTPNWGADADRGLLAPMITATAMLAVAICANSTVFSWIDGTIVAEATVECSGSLPSRAKKPAGSSI